MNVKALALAPVIVPQALWVAARAARLPEAGGARSGAVGTGPPLRLLVLGDSSAAGVGVETQSEALGGRLADALAQRFTVQWHVLAKSGGTVRSTRRMVAAQPDGAMDVVCIALGVNDAKNGHSLRAWTDGYTDLLQEVSAKFGARCICVSGLPPVRHFPVLPSPLSGVLGDRIELFDHHLRQIADTREGTHYLPLDFSMEVTQMAPDGFHPGPEIYHEWARRAAQLLAQIGY